MNIRNEILDDFEQLKDDTYSQFQAKLIPTINPKSVIGVRTPELRKMAKVYGKREDCEEFLNALPHTYFEENQLHSFIVCLNKDFDSCVSQVETFLPYIDNWATCDQLSPNIFKKEKEKNEYACKDAEGNKTDAFIGILRGFNLIRILFHSSSPFLIF